MPTMSRPALDVKGGTSPAKEVSFAILQMETLRHGIMNRLRVVCQTLLGMVSSVLQQTGSSRAFFGDNENCFCLNLIKLNLWRVLKDGREGAEKQNWNKTTVLKRLK